MREEAVTYRIWKQGALLGQSCEDKPFVLHLCATSQRINGLGAGARATALARARGGTRLSAGFSGCREMS